MSSSTIIRETSFTTVRTGGSTGIALSESDNGGIEAWRYVGATDQPAFQNSWGNLGIGQERAAFRKDRRRVHLGGVMFGGALDVTVFTLPAGYRPATATKCIGFVASLSGLFYFALISISPAGVVKFPPTAFPLPPGQSSWIVGGLEGMSSFSLDPIAT